MHLSRSAILAATVSLRLHNVSRGSADRGRCRGGPEFPDRSELVRAAGELNHPGVPPVALDFSKPLTGAEIAAIAVLANPDLRALRTQQRVADAQVFASGLLPDPQLSAGFDAVLSRTTRRSRRATRLACRSMSWPRWSRAMSNTWLRRRPPRRCGSTSHGRVDDGWTGTDPGRPTRVPEAGCRLGLDRGGRHRASAGSRSCGLPDPEI
jgi:hypothetical protein